VRYQTAVDTGWRNPQLKVGRQWGNEQEDSPGRTGIRTFPDEVNMPRRPFSRYAQWGDSSFEGDIIGLRVYATNPFVNRWLRRSGAASARATEAESKEAAYAVFCEVRSLCLEAEMVREESALLEQMVGLREQACGIRREQSEAGVVSALELIRTETRLASLRAEIREKQASRQQLLRQIAVLARIPVEQVRLRPTDFKQQVNTNYLTEAALTDLAFLRRPDLARAQCQKEAAAYSLSAAKAGLIPWLEYVEGSYESEQVNANSYEQYYTGFDTTRQDATEWQMRAAVTVPIFNWLGDEVRLTRKQLAAAETREQGLYERIRREVCGVLEDYQSVRAEREQVAGESECLRKTMTERIDALASEPTVRREDVLAAREELLGYVRVCMKVEREHLRLAQYLETVSGGSLMTLP
jgi:outer membrane protein TolC